MKLDSLEMETVDSNDSLFFQVDTLIVLTENEYLETENVKIAKLKKHPPLDSVQLKKHSPKKASWLAIIPGAGQIYNKKYWKLPIVYGGLGATGFLIYYYADKTSIFRKEYVARVNGKTDNRNPKLSEYSDDNILELRNFYRRNMEICVAVCTVVYFLSILDACVDAHLYYYDISENLAIAVKPKIDYYPINGSTTAGMGLVLKF
ncbi:MAG: DUF5683 domain-containing protein [Bacteroidales bacterium]|jgi:hypothetical protein|nr:DUF5683 domain-containing protein [Bacteroidales bacterium]